ncbi:MAG: DUF5654 family protein [Chloroflexi bacterium]|nr:DUF5654 family protein [Chloroflexota bacterium]
MVGQVKNPSKSAYLTTMISLASAAFGVIAALAWNAAITQLFTQVLGKATGLVSLFIYAIIVTVVAVIVMVNLAHAAERLGGTEKTE